MKVIGLDGKNYLLNPEKDSLDIDEENKSSLHVKAYSVIKKSFPYAKIFEEVILAGCRGIGGRLLRSDFMIPSMKIIIEVHGQQHYIQSDHFHKAESDFKKCQSNDQIKKEWAELNGFTFIELPYNEIKEWRKIINEHIS